MYYIYSMIDKSKQIAGWLSNHPLFSINGMCKLIGLNTANFMKYKAAEKIPDKYIEPIENILSEYGYLRLTFSKPDSGAFTGPKMNKTILDEAGKWKEPSAQNIKDFTKPSPGSVKNLTEKPPTTNYQINTAIPPAPVRQEGENAFDFAARKNAWKQKYNQ